MTLWKLKISSLFNRLQSQADLLLISILRILATITGAIVLFIVFFLILEAIPVLQDEGIVPFFTDSSWNPAEGLYNLTPMLLGTLFVTLGSVLIATPLGILSAVFCQYYAPAKIAYFYRRLIELLAGIPSVVYGFWGLVVLVPLINSINPPGTSLLAGIIILTIMILPTIALIADASFAKIPEEYLIGAASLGLSQWGTIVGVVFPAAKSGLFTGVILETGRAIGETMAVLMVCGNVVQIPGSIFDPMRALTANIALEMAYALGNHRSALFVSGLGLMGMIIILVIASEIINEQ